MSRKNESIALAGGCLAASALIATALAVNLTIGGVAFDYCLWNVAGKDVPWYVDCIAGAALGEFVIPAAVVVWVAKMCGMATPLLSLVAAAI